MQPLICPRCKVVFGNTLVVSEGQIVTCHHCGSRNLIQFEERRNKPRNIYDTVKPTWHVVITAVDEVGE